MLFRSVQFFVAPLISPEGIERERNAVSSEHDGNINSDTWRQMQLWKLAGNQAHPYTRFFTGNMVTLGTRPEAAGVDVHSAVVDFHRTYYSANRMTVAVMGRDSLDDLQAIVERSFLDVPDKGAYLVLHAFSCRSGQQTCSGVDLLVFAHADLLNHTKETWA